MKSFPPSLSRLIRGPGLGLLLVGAWHPATSHADSPPTLVEIRAQFVHASRAELNAALHIAHVGREEILTPEKFAAVQASLDAVGAKTFSEVRTIAETDAKTEVDGPKTGADIVKELRYPTKYEPSKKEPGKSVPTDFDLRLVGERLEAVAEKHDGGINLLVSPMYTRFLGFVDYSNVAPGEKDPPALEDLLKAPLKAGDIWRPFFATFAVTGSFYVTDSGTIILSGPVAVESVTPPPGKPALQSHAVPEDVAVFVTVKKVVRN